MSAPALFLGAIEVSGDARGARLARELRRLLPGHALFGLGGARMADAGVAIAHDLSDAGTIGFLDHWGSVGRFAAALRWVRRALRERRPAAVVVVDAPGLAFPIARHAHALGIPVVWYVTPQTWLWSPRPAVERLRACAEVVVPAFRDEAELYAAHGLDVVYHGHPVVDDVADACAASPATAARCDVVVAPGSRRHAIRRHLGAMLDAAQATRARAGLHEVRIALAAEAFRGDVERIVRRRRAPAPVIDTDFTAALARGRVLIAASGGNLLEAALAGVPAVACYRIDPLSALIARHVVRLRDHRPYLAIPSIVAGRKVVPELLQGDVVAGRIADHAVQLASEGAGRAAVLDGYALVRERLGAPGVVRRIAADIVARLALRN